MGEIDFELRDSGACCTFLLRTFGNFMQTQSAFYCFLVTKKKLLKALSTCTFIPSLLNSFNVSSGSSELSKRDMIRLLMSLGAGGLKVVLLGGKLLTWRDKSDTFCIVKE